MEISEGTKHRCPACVRVYENRVAIQVRCNGMKHNESFFFDSDDDLTDINTMRWYIRKAIVVRNTLKYGDANYLDDMPTDEVLQRLFSDYRPPERPVKAPYQPHEATLAAKRDVRHVLQRYALV